MIILNAKQIKWLEDFWIRNLTKSEKIQYVYSKWYIDIDFFWDFFLRSWKWKETPDVHHEIQTALSSKENTNIIIARWHWKTTTILINIIHSLVYEIYGSQLYIASAGLWSESLWKIKYELETNQHIKEVFWNLVPHLDAKAQEQQWTKKWKEKLLELTNGESIETLTKGNPVRWKRPSRITVDDLEENKDVMSTVTVEKTRKWFFSSLYNTLLPWWKIIILGTIVGNMCMVKHIKDTKDWQTIEYKAIENWKPLWTDMWSMEELEKRKKEIGTILFNQEFMNIPFQVEHTIVKQEHIQYFDYTWQPFDYINIWVDPAISEKTSSDPFAIVVTAEKWNKKYVLEAIELKERNKDPFKATKTLKSIYNKYKANRVTIETIAFQQVMSKLLKAENMAVTDVTPNRDKVTRLMEWQWEFEQGNIYFNREKTFDLVDQLLQFPDVQHDDLVDAMVYSFRKTKKSFIIDTF